MELCISDEVDIVFGVCDLSLIIFPSSPLVPHLSFQVPIENIDVTLSTLERKIIPIESP